MKKAFVAVENLNEITPEVKEHFNHLADKYHAEIQGVVQYPKGMALECPEAFVEAMKKIGADYVLASSPEFIIHEILTDGELARMAKAENLSIVNTTLEVDIATIKDVIPDFIMKELESLLNLKTAMDMPLKEMMQKLKEKSNVMFITKDAESERFKGMIDDMARQSYHQLSVIEMTGYVPPMNQMLETTIQEQRIDKIVVVDEYDSTEFNEFLKQQKGNGIEVTYEFDQMNITMNNILMN